MREVPNRVVTPDDEKIQLTVEQDRKLQQQERTRLWIEQQMRNCPVVSADGVSLKDPAQQMGRPLTPAQLEEKLRKIVAGLVFVHHPHNKTKKALFLQAPEGLEFICAYENDLMPEHSLMRTLVHEYPDPALFTGQRTIERNELPDYEKVEDKESPVGYSYKFDPDAPRPGMVYVEKGFGEEKRGWRTVLLRLVQRGLLSVEAAEREFGADDRPEWAKNTGKQDALPTW